VYQPASVSFQSAPIPARSSDELFHILYLTNLKQNATIHDDYYTTPFGVLMHSYYESARQIGKSLSFSSPGGLTGQSISSHQKLTIDVFLLLW